MRLPRTNKERIACFAWVCNAVDGERAATALNKVKLILIVRCLPIQFVDRERFDTHRAMRHRVDEWHARRPLRVRRAWQCGYEFVEFGFHGVVFF